MTKKRTILVATACCLLAGICPLAGQALFQEDFEEGLSGWVGKGGWPHHGTLVDDPLRPGNKVLKFTALNSGGDMFSPAIPVVAGETYVLSFEYLGLPGLGGVPGNLGGFIGFSEFLPGFHRWLAGTVLCCGAEDDPLIDDGQWHSYAIEFDPYWPRPPWQGTIHIMLEDFVGSLGVVGDAFFDNVQLGPAILEIAIDLRPGDDPNSVNPASRGRLAVAVLSTESFDAMTVEVQTVTFGAEGTEATPVHAAAEDVDEDGDLDLLLHFKTPHTGLECGDTEVFLLGKTSSGQAVGGSDRVRTVGCR